MSKNLITAINQILSDIEDIKIELNQFKHPKVLNNNAIEQLSTLIREIQNLRKHFTTNSYERIDFDYTQKSLIGVRINDKGLIFSYNTIIAIINEDICYTTDKKYSRTTGKHKHIIQSYCRTNMNLTYKEITHSDFRLLRTNVIFH